jgi:S1-C subfamily serine protease
MSKPWCSRALLVGLFTIALVPLCQGAEAKKGYLGVQIRKDADADKIQVLSVEDDGPAKKAGIESGDLLVMVGDLKPTDLPSTVKFIQSLKPGMKIKVRVERGGQEKEYEVTIGER